MKKIAFVVCQYGKEVNGGAEVHCKMLAERLTSHYEVHVLTSTIIDYSTFDPYYNVGTEHINQVTVKRFDSKPFDRALHEVMRRKSKWGRKIRRTLYRIKLLKWIANTKPIWNLCIEKEKEWLRTHGFYSPDLLDYVEKHGHEYDSIILMSYPYPHTFFVTEMFPKTCILIPTAHEEGDLYRSLQTHIFTKVGHIAFNTPAEKQLCIDVFGNQMADNSILAVGVDLADPATREHIYTKFDLPDQYLLYFGRITPGKVGLLTNWFLEYKERFGGELKLVMTGRLFMDRLDHPDIIYTGFVNEAEKTALIQYARLIINPSEKESLSLLLLEAMQIGKPSLVNGRSEVMKQHCIDSDFACRYYYSKRDFLSKLHNILSEDPDHIAAKAQNYVQQNYNWDIIMNKLIHLIERTPDRN